MESQTTADLNDQQHKQGERRHVSLRSPAQSAHSEPLRFTSSGAIQATAGRYTTDKTLWTSAVLTPMPKSPTFRAIFTAHPPRGGLGVCSLGGSTDGRYLARCICGWNMSAPRSSTKSSTLQNCALFNNPPRPALIDPGVRYLIGCRGTPCASPLASHLDSSPPTPAVSSGRTCPPSPACFRPWPSTWRS